MRGRLDVIGLGPGARGLLTPDASQALQECDTVLGYRPYIEQVCDLVADKQLVPSGMGEERDRAASAVALAREGRRVALVSGGDAGIYGTAGLVFEHLAINGWVPGVDVDVRVLPGLTAASAAAALLGAPLAADFAVVSLSDEYILWSAVLKRLAAVAEADMVIVLYEPASPLRPRHIFDAQRELGLHLAPETPVGIVRNAFRPDQRVVLTTLAEMGHYEYDMRTIVVVGNSRTRSHGGRMFTMRRYGD